MQSPVRLPYRAPGSRAARRRWLRAASLLALALAAAAGLAWQARFELARLRLGLPAFSHRAGPSRFEEVAMRDGVRLATLVERPAGAGPWPVILMRSPYDLEGRLGSQCALFVRYGYACVQQNVRGRLRSEGEWEPLVNEREDGLDTLAWLRRQPWQDGNVALFGPSYLGATQWAVADALPPEVKTLVPMHSGTDFHSLIFERGLFHLDVITAWSALMPGRGMRDDHGRAFREALRHRPHVEVDERFFGARLPWYREWLEAESPQAPLWVREDVARFRSAPARTRVPVLITVGWHDPFLPAALANYHELASRAQSKLVIGPWDHLLRSADDLEHPVGFGMQFALALDWIGHYLRGEPLDQAASGVESYALREGRWRHWEDFPPPTRPLRLALAEAARAAECPGGRLAAAAPTRAETVSYRYDPDHPLPSRGGAALLAFAIPHFGGVRPGSVEQRDLCEREDVVRFLSAPLESELHLAGSLRISLSVSSDAPDTAFTATLHELTPEGRVLNVREAASTLAWRSGGSQPESYQPGDVVRVELETWPVEWRVRAGSRLRLDVSSSSFPAYHAHTNRAGPWAEQREAVPARQTLYTGGERASFVELPVWRSDPDVVVAAGAAR